MKRNHDPSETRPKSNRGLKWNTTLKDTWNNRSLYEYEGEGIMTDKQPIVLPGDPNALVKRLDLLMASKAAGNTGVRNELVGICDELLRQKVINKRECKNILSHM